MVKLSDGSKYMISRSQKGFTLEHIAANGMMISSVDYNTMSDITKFLRTVQS